MGLDNKISFLSGFVLTSIWTMSLYELTMALFLGIVGGMGGIIGKWIIKKLGWFGQTQDRREK
jgi:hypothetical protein